MSAAVLAALSGPTRASQDCVPSESDSLGPFYVAGTPTQTNLNQHGKSGDPVSVSGRILSAGPDRRPIVGARVEIWQTDGKGDYHPQGSGSVGDYESAEVDLRGSLHTGGAGEYRFESVVPGGYFPRPRHFHYRITAAGHIPLVTQLYITGDGLFRQPGGDCRHAPLTRLGDGYRYEAPDLFLEPE